MPRVTRSKQQIPPPNIDKSTPAPGIKTVLQPKSTNISNRPAENSNKKRKSSTFTESKPKRRAAAQSTPASLEVPIQVSSWDVEGTYRVEVDKPKADSAGFRLSIYHSRLDDDYCEYYAAFKFDKLSGIMRLCPQPELSNTQDPRNNLELPDFEAACRLNSIVIPGPENKKWVMRWRGNDGGLRMNRKVGGEVNINGAWEYDLDDDKTTTFQGIRLAFVFIYDDHVFGVKARKIANLKQGDKAMMPQQMRAKWEVTSDSDSEPELAWNNMKYFNSPPQHPTKKKLPARKGTTVGKPKNISASQNSYIELPPDWAYDITGQWKVDESVLGPLASKSLPPGASLTMEIRMTNNPRHSRVSRQYWCEFDFAGEIIGTMRFCPESLERCDTVKWFEAVCKLNKGCWPGNSPKACNKWAIRWRGKRRDGEVDLMDENMGGQIKFKKDKTGKLTLEGVFMNYFMPTIIKAEKVGDLPPPGQKQATLTTSWDSWAREYKVNYGLGL